MNDKENRIKLAGNYYNAKEAIEGALQTLASVQGDCECDNPTGLTYDIYPEGAKEYTICIECGGVVEPKGYFS